MTETTEALPTLFRPADVARSLSCSEWWVKEQARQRRIPFVRVGGAYRFTAAHFADIVSIFEERPHRERVAPQRSAPRTTARPRRSAQPVDGATVTALVARPPRRMPKSA